MERAVVAGLGKCLRWRMAGSCTSGKGLQNQRFLASSIYPMRTLASLTHPPTSPPTSRSSTTTSLSHSKLQPRVSRPYSTSESSIQGTIGKGQSGVADEAERTVVALAAPDHLNDKEREIWDKLMAELKCTELLVQDISGGCGSMYGIEIVSERFRGLNMLKQQRLVNQVLGDEIKQWHGIQLKTRVP